MKTKINFSIYDNGSPKSLILIDESVYFDTPSSPLIELTLPNFKKVYSVPVEARGLIALNSKLIGFSDGVIDLPDGIYNIRYSVAPNATAFLCKNIFKVSSVKARLKDFLCSELEEDLVEKLYKVDLYLQAAEATVQDMPHEAEEFYKKAKKIIERLELNN